MKIVLHAEVGSSEFGRQNLMGLILKVLDLNSGEVPTTEQLSQIFTDPVKAKVNKLFLGEDADLDCADLVELGAVCQLSNIQLLISLGALSGWDSISPDSDEMIELLALRGLFCRLLVAGKLSASLNEKMAELSSSLSKWQSSVHLSEQLTRKLSGSSADSNVAAVEEPCPSVNWDVI